MIRRERLRIGDVEGGPDPTDPKLPDERGGLDRLAATGVHDERAVRQQAEPSGVQHAIGLARQRQDVHEDLGVAEDVVEVGQAAYAVARGSPHTDHLDAERAQPVRDRRSDRPEAEDDDASAEQLGWLDGLPRASRLRVAGLHEAALHRQDRADHPLRERRVVDAAGVADHDVLGHSTDEPVDAGARGLDGAQPSPSPVEQLEQSAASPIARHDEVGLTEIRHGRWLGWDEQDLDVRRQLAHVDQLGDVGQAHDDAFGKGCHGHGLRYRLDDTRPVVAAAPVSVVGRRRASLCSVKVTAEAARRFLMARHFLAPARSLEGLDGVLEVFQRLGSIQFDPIAVAGRNHDLVLHARVAGYEPAWCDELYERHELFETTNKALSFIPMSEVPWFRSSSGRKGRRFHAAALADNAAVAERVLERIRAEGPLSSGDFERQAGATKDWFGMPENAVRSVLEAYTVAGVVGLARREGNVRYYDLVERLLPAEVLAHEVPLRDQLRHKLLSRYHAHGLLAAGGAGGTFARIADPPERNELRKELVEAGALVPVDVEGLRGTRFVLAEELALLESLVESVPESTPSVAFIAPFDSLLWDTALLESLFDFEYTWEGFFPPAKRRWGYYVLPIVFGDRFVGRIEPRIDRDEARVEIIGTWWEDGFTPDDADGFVEAMRDALCAYVRFAGAGDIEWAAHLDHEKRLFRVAP